jgi:WD40 repeat protein
MVVLQKLSTLAPLMRGYICVLLFISICSYAQVDSLSYHADHTDDITCITFSPNSKYIITGSWDQSIVIHKNDSTTEIVQTIEGFKGAVNTIAFSRDGFKMIAGGQDGGINFYTFNDSLFEIATLDTTLFINESQINKLIYGPGMRTIFSAGDDGRLITYDLAKEKAIPMRGKRSISAAAVAIDRMSYFVAVEGKATITQVDIFGKVLNTFSGHNNDITDLLVTVDRKYLISSSKDKTVRVWEIANAKEETVFADHTWAVTDIDMDPFGLFLVSGGLDGIANLYDLKARTILKTQELPGYKINAVSLSPDNTQIAAAAQIEKDAESAGYFIIDTDLKPRKVVLPKQFDIEVLKKKNRLLKAKKQKKANEVAVKKQGSSDSDSNSETKPNTDEAVIKKTKQVKITIKDNE